MTNREIKFKAAYSLDTGTVIIDNVVVYSDQTLGCSLKDFEKALAVGYYIDADIEIRSVSHDYEVVGKIVDSKEEWIWFEGKPLQFTGLHDCEGNEIYEGHAVERHTDGFVGVVAYHIQSASYQISSVEEKRLSILTNRTAMTGSEQGILLDDIEILGFIDQEPNLITK